MYPQTDWYAMVAMTAAFGVTVVPTPRGEIVRRGGRLVIGVISIHNGRVFATPRIGLSLAQKKSLLAAAWRVFHHGPEGTRWKFIPDAGLVATVFEPTQLSCTVSRAMAMSSAVGDPKMSDSDWPWR